MMPDLRHALRSLRSQPGFTIVAVLTLAFGIGVNATLFAMLSAFFLQPLAVKDSHELVVVMQRGDAIDVPYGYSYPDYLDFRGSLTALPDLAAYMPTPVHLSAPGQTPERTWIEVVSPDYFALAQVAPAIGEFPRPGEGEHAGAAPTVVLSHRYWVRRFGGDPSLVGRAITLNGRPFTVTGIAPESFTGLSWAMAVSAFVPSGAIGTLVDQGDAFRDDRGTPAWRLMGRLAPGMTVHDARAEVDLVLQRLAAAYPAEHKNSRALVVPENRARPDPSIAGFLPAFAVVFTAMVALVLLIACANVANLMLSRAVARRRDLVVRSALGASRARLIRLQLVESLLLAGAAAIVGMLLAHWAGQALAALVPQGDIPINQDHPFDWRVYLFAAVVAILAGLATGFWPARSATRFVLVESLKEGTGAASPRHALRNLLVVGQVAMSLVVLVTAGLFLQSLRQMQGIVLGFRTDGLLMMSIDLGLQQYSDDRGRHFLEHLLTRVEALPGVQSATLATHVPFDYGMQFTDVSTGQEISGTQDDYVTTPFNVVGTGFFETTGIALVHGRGFDRRDTDTSRRVAVVNETMAATLWPGQDATGRRFRFGRDGAWVDVIGVARDGKYMMLAEATRPYFFVPLLQVYRSPVALIARTTSDDVRLADPMQRLLAELDPDLPVFNVRTMRQHVRDSVFGLLPLRAGATIASAQGAVGLLLAVLGLYAVVSYSVARRTREIGVRIALGAEPRDVLRLVVREGMRLSLIGLAVGTLIALGIGLVLSKVLYGLTSLEPSVFTAVLALLLTVSAFACYVPARRATAIDPLTALRHE